MIILWDKLNGKQMTKMLHLRYFSELLQFTCKMFEWILPPEIEPEYMERFLNCNGLVGICKTDSGYKIAMGSTTGKLNQYGIGENFIGETLGGDFSMSGKIGDDIAICWHNGVHTPNLDISRTAETLAEYDKSIFRIVQMTKANPIFAAKDEITKKAIESAETKIVNGDIVCVLSDNALTDYTGRENVTKLDITEPRYSEYLQYLNMGMDYEYKRYYQKYGHAMQTTSKHSITLMDELHGADSISFVIPMDMLKCRKDFCDMANSIFGGGFSVKFSEMWQREFEKYKSENENSKRLENPENTPKTEKNENESGENEDE